MRFNFVQNNSAAIERELERGALDLVFVAVPPGRPGLEWVRVRKAGRRLFVLVSFLLTPDRSAQEMDDVRRVMTEELARLNPDLDLDVGILFKTG